MFEAAEVGHKISKTVFREQVPELRAGLLRAQNELREERTFSVVIVIAGVDGAGRGETGNTLCEWLDPRFLETHAYDSPTSEELDRPPLWRFWRDLPPRGRIGMFFGSWYTQPIVSRALGESNDAEFESALDRIDAFERELVADGVLLLKFWFHLSKKEQHKRFSKLSKDPELSWKVTETDLRNAKRYDHFLPVCERALRRTSTGDAQWTLVEGKDRRYRELEVGRRVFEAIDERLKVPCPAQHTPTPPQLVERGQPTILNVTDLSPTLAKEDYERRLTQAQARLGHLSRDAYAEGAAAVFVFEGWDAAGKGGAVRRVTAAMDARFYDTVSIAAPSDEESARPYMWRFWRHLPPKGHAVIFDRSWYGRVLVERVEGFAAPEDWRRAYREIDDFESLLSEHGYGIAKFWLHIDRDEQARRFEERERTPHKRYKITEEDYRNREKWDLYEDAVNEMIERTSTGHAPWTVVPATDTRSARVAVVARCCEALEAALAVSGNSRP